MSLKPAVSTTDHAIGKTNAEIVIVEYGDYQCPHCGAAYPILKEIVNKYGKEIKFVFRNFPLSQMHQFARPAALAAEAADVQGKFWEMHDAIYENQQYLNEKFLFELAERLNLDIEQFNIDINKAEVAKKVDSDFESGMMSGINGSPSLFVNNKIFDRSPEDLLQHLSEVFI